MARFYTSVDNSRGNEVTAMGTVRGQHAHIRGWDAGVEVRAHPAHGANPDADSFDIYMTTGSRGTGRSVLIGSVVATDKGPVFVPEAV